MGTGGGGGMSDLISRRELNKMIQDYDTGTINVYELLDKIRNIQTAYDVDKIIDNLKESDLYIDQEKCITVEDAIKIVKGGGRDE